jgi:hypothetical protein
MDYTKTEIIEKIKQEIKERTAKWKQKHIIII